VICKLTFPFGEQTQANMSDTKDSKAPVRVLITGAAGQIGYSIIPLVANGSVFGADQPIILHLLDIPPAQKMLEGVVMEIEDCAYPLLRGLVATVNLDEATKGVNYAILVGGFPRKDGMTRADLMAKNSPIFVGQGKALSDHADPNCKVLVIANPANTNALVALKNAPKLKPENFSCLTRLDMNRAKGQLAKKLGVAPERVKNAVIWGNHSSSMFVDTAIAVVTNPDGSEAKVNAKIDAEWLRKDFTSTVAERGAAVIKARGFSSALSAAQAAADHMRNWISGTKPGEIVSMGIYSDGSYGVAKDIIFSFPVTCKDGKYTVVQGLSLDEVATAALKKTEKELLEERDLVLNPPKPTA